VIEISTIAIRDEASLNEKLKGALENYNVNQNQQNNNSQPDIRKMFSPQSQQKQKEAKPKSTKFSVILIDEVC
jgi:hypothetical protein